LPSNYVKKEAKGYMKSGAIRGNIKKEILENNESLDKKKVLKLKIFK
jgi:hypothetical protein